MAKKPALLLVVDGLRPDSITNADMPALEALRRRGTTFTNARAAVPSVTRVNAAVLATGTYPEKTGILGNRVIIPEIDRSQPLNLQRATDLLQIGAVTGRIVQSRTMAERLEEQDLLFGMVSSGSGGTALSASPSAPTGSGLLINCDDPDAPGDLSFPASLAPEVRNRFGEPPTKQGVRDKLASVQYGTAVLTEFMLPELQPDLAMFWMTEPDGVQHAHHVGSPHALSVLRQVDACIGRVVEAADRLHGPGQTNIVVVSDHGFTEAPAPRVDVESELVAAGLKEAPTSSDVIVVNNGCVAIHVADSEAERIQAVVAFLQRQEWTDTLFTAPADPAATSGSAAAAGWVEGTFSRDLIHLGGSRASDILVTPRWTSDQNGFGTRGRTSFSDGAKPSYHGSLSPWDMQSTLIASGPDIREGVLSHAPAGNVDVAPTLLSLCGIEDVDGMDGRVLREAFVDGDDPAQVPMSVDCFTTRGGNDRYSASIQLSTVHGVRYPEKSWRVT